MSKIHFTDILKDELDEILSVIPPDSELNYVNTRFQAFKDVLYIMKLLCFQCSISCMGSPGGVLERTKR